MCAPKDERPGHEQVRVGVRVQRRIGRAFGERDVPRVGHEAAELGHGYRVAVDRERLDRDLADWPLLEVELVAAHEERPTGQRRHPAPLRDVI